MQRNIVVKYFKSADVSVVKAFYENTTYRNADSVKEEDEIVAAFDGDKMIGTFRLCEENGVCVLRGFNVLKEFQRKGIGSLMLMKFANELVDRECYLICRRELNVLYSKVGFKLCEDNVPGFLSERKQKYNNEELNILSRNKR